MDGERVGQLRPTRPTAVVGEGREATGVLDLNADDEAVANAKDGRTRSSRRSLPSMSYATYKLIADFLSQDATG